MIKKRRGFTLIELLVVIAIIAILAAILFPVFAQAKRAAKGAVALSDAKQMALAQLMYTNDYDDYFSPVVSYHVIPGSPNVYPIETFAYLQQPYMKSWSILADPTGPNVPVTGTSGNGTFSSFALYGLWGMPPERVDAASNPTPDQYSFGQQPLGAAMTGGQLWDYDGIGGVSVAATDTSDQTAHYDWSSWGYKVGGTASLQTTQVANPSDQLMIAQSGTWDFMWENTGTPPAMGFQAGDFGNGNDTPDNFDLYYSGCGSNAYGCAATVCGPIARDRDNDANIVGWWPWHPSATQPATQTLPTGLVIYAATDGHAKAVPWRQLFGQTVSINGGANKALKAFWPSGS